MFKKSLAAVALLGAFAGSAFAADVTLYGVVDEGFLYTHKDADNIKMRTKPILTLLINSN